MSEWEREGGMGGGEGGANLHFLFLHQGRVFLTVYWVGGGGLPFFPETFIFIGIVLLNRDLNLGEIEIKLLKR